MTLCALTALSPVDGRYEASCAPLGRIVSEFGLISRRVIVEVRWLELMGDTAEIKEVPSLLATERVFLRKLEDLSLGEAQKIKDIEKETNHDVKAVEYYIKDRLRSCQFSRLAECVEFVHFCCTSEDINNLAYALMLKDAIAEIIRPAMREIVAAIADLAKREAECSMLSRTHGQAASPTTFGKEMAIFAFRLQQQIERYLDRIQFTGKFNGAVGNFNAHVVAYPEISSWEQVACRLVQDKLQLQYQPFSTQIECHDYISELCDVIARFNTILQDFTMDMWSYISRDLLTLKIIASEAGSSTMPHKVNPIDFENAEGNLGVANALLKFFSSKLPVSRLQRDLTDSTILRNLGVALAHSTIAYKSCLKGLNKVEIDSAAMSRELEQNWAVLAEPIQTVMRRLRFENPYEQLKDLTRGKKCINQAVIHNFVKGLKLPEEEEMRLLKLSPTSYTGNASELARRLPANCFAD